MYEKYRSILSKIRLCRRIFSKKRRFFVVSLLLSMRLCVSRSMRVVLSAAASLPTIYTQQSLCTTLQRKRERVESRDSKWSPRLLSHHHQRTSHTHSIDNKNGPSRPSWPIWKLHRKKIFLFSKREIAERERERERERE